MKEKKGKEDKEMSKKSLGQKPDRVRELRSKNKEGKRIRVQFDIDYGGSPGKKMNSKSETIPDLNLTVTQLMQMHTRGQNGRVSAYEPLYFETEIPVINDITDVDNYKEQLQARLDEVNGFIAAEKEIQENEKRKAEAKKQKDELSGISEKETEPSSEKQETKGS